MGPGIGQAPAFTLYILEWGRGKFQGSVRPGLHALSCFTLFFSTHNVQRNYLETNNVLTQNSEAIVQEHFHFHFLWWMKGQHFSDGQGLTVLFIIVFKSESISPALITFRTKAALRLRKCKGSNAKGCVGVWGVFNSTLISLLVQSCVCAQLELWKTDTNCLTVIEVIYSSHAVHCNSISHLAWAWGRHSEVNSNSCSPLQKCMSNQELCSLTWTDFINLWVEVNQFWIDLRAEALSQVMPHCLYDLRCSCLDSH